MGGVKEEVYNLFNRNIKKHQHFQSIVAHVKSVDKENFTCDVLPADGSPEFYNVRLQAIIDNNDKGVVFIPKIKSSVVVSLINNNDNHCYISQYSELEEFIYKIDNLEFSGNTTGIRVNNQGESLKTVVNNLIESINNQNDQVQELNNILQKVIVINGSSPNVPGLIQINGQLSEIKKGNQKIKQRLNRILKD